MNSASIIRFGFVGLLLLSGLSLASKAATTQTGSVQLESAPSHSKVCRLGHSC